MAASAAARRSSAAAIPLVLGRPWPPLVPVDNKERSVLDFVAFEIFFTALFPSDQTRRVAQISCVKYPNPF